MIRRFGSITAHTENQYGAPSNAAMRCGSSHGMNVATSVPNTAAQAATNANRKPPQTRPNKNGSAPTPVAMSVSSVFCSRSRVNGAATNATMANIAMMLKMKCVWITVNGAFRFRLSVPPPICTSSLAMPMNASTKKRSEIAMNNGLRN